MLLPYELFFDEALLDVCKGLCFSGGKKRKENVPNYEI